MPFVSRAIGDRMREFGLQVVALPTSPPDGLVHYAQTKHHFMCNPTSKENKRGSPHWSKVTCPECLKMGKRTGRQENGVARSFIDMEKERNQPDDV